MPGQQDGKLGTRHGGPGQVVVGDLARECVAAQAFRTFQVTTQGGERRFVAQELDEHLVGGRHELGGALAYFRQQRLAARHVLHRHRGAQQLPGDVGMLDRILAIERASPFLQRKQAFTCLRRLSGLDHRQRLPFACASIFQVVLVDAGLLEDRQAARVRGQRLRVVAVVTIEIADVVLGDGLVDRSSAGGARELGGAFVFAQGFAQATHRLQVAAQAGVILAQLGAAWTDRLLVHGDGFAQQCFDLLRLQFPDGRAIDRLGP